MLYTKLCAQSRNVLQILFCAVDFSPQKKGEARTQSSRTQSYSGILPPSLDNFWHSGTWRRVLFSLLKGAGHGHSLVTGAVFRPENQELRY